VEESSQRAKVIELFEKHRATPGASFDEQHFLDFLLRSPTKTRAVYDSFRGLRRFNAFINDVQLEFAICFSLKDRDANYSLSKFVERVVELEKSRRGSLMSLKNQRRAGAEWNLLVLANIVLLMIGAWLRTNGWAMAILVAVAALLNVLFVRFVHKEKAYLAQLQARIENSGA
jgi:hypothetical protein